MERQKLIHGTAGLGCVSIAILLAYYFIASYDSYLLFHCLVEGFCIVVATAVFMILWNCRDIMQNNFLLFVGIAYVFVGGLDFAHTLAYKGMGVFQNEGANLPTQLWLSARLLESVTLLLAPLLATRDVARHIVIIAYTLVTVSLLVSIFYLDVFPTCYIDDVINGGRLTQFKIVTEYLVCVVLALSVILLHRRQSLFDAKACDLMMVAILLTIASELAFTAYTSPFGDANYGGHVFKMASFYFVYKALVQRGLQRPYANLFGDLEQTKNHLQQMKKELEVRVVERTAALTESQEQLSRSQARLVTAQRVAHLGHWEWDLASGHILWSDEVYRILGVKPGDLMPSLDGLISRVHPDDQARVEKVIKNALVKGKTKNLDHRVVCPDGTEKIVHQRIKVMDDDYQHPDRIVVTIQDITVRKVQEQRIQEHRKMLSFLTAQLLQTEEREKRRVAVALHDSIAQILAFAKREISSLEKDSSAERQERLGLLKTQIGYAIQQTRDIIFDLSPSTLYTLGLAAALEELAGQFSEKEAFHCQLYTIGRPVSLPDELKMLLYRSVRELLINITKHAQAQHVAITLRRNLNSVQVEVADDGCGFDQTQWLQSALKPVGFGIFSMKEHLKHMGGDLVIESSLGAGTKVRLSIPIPSADTWERSAQNEYSRHPGR